MDGRRIAYVGPVPPLRGGIAQTGDRIIRALREEGHAVDAHTWASQYPRLLYPGEFPDRSDGPPGVQRRLRWWSPRSWWCTGRDIRPVDLLVFPWVTPFQGPAYRTILTTCGRPAVAVVHNPRPHEPRFFDALVTRWVLSRVVGAVTFAVSGAQELRDLVPGIRVVGVTHPPNLDVRVGPPPAGPPYRLLFFGLVRPYKGLEDAIDAVALLVRQGIEVELTVAGEFWGGMNPWTETLRHKGLEERVCLRPGYVPDEQVDALFSDHHVLVAPYRSATQSGVVPIALAAGRPVVATAVGGLPELVVEGRTGSLARPADPRSLADAIERALRLPSPMSASGFRPDTWRDVAQAILSVGGV